MILLIIAIDRKLFIELISGNNMAGKNWYRKVLFGFIGLLTIVFLFYISYFLKFKYFKNFYTVIDNKIYRSAQPDIYNIKQWQQQFNIHSILNLRGQDFSSNDKNNNEIMSYSKKQLNSLKLYYVELSSDLLPTPTELNLIIDYIEHSPKPMLIHCKNGVDRSGLVSAIAKILNNYSVDDALQEFTWTKGFLPYREQDILKILFFDYKNWLKDSNRFSTKENFIYWAKNKYIPSYYNVDIKLLSDKKIYYNNKKSSNAFKIQLTNTSNYPIPLRKNTSAGVYLIGCYYIKDTFATDCLSVATKYPYIPNDINEKFAFVETNDSLDYDLQPNQHIIIDLPLHRKMKPGEYILELDLADKGRKIFSDFGSAITRENIALVQP